LDQRNQPDQRKRHEPDPRLFDTNRTTGDRTVTGAFDLCVQIPVDNVIVNAARPAHRNGAEQHPKCQIPTLGKTTCEAEAIDAGPKEQPPANRPVEPRE
jgi:hypothetical protein